MILTGALFTKTAIDNLPKAQPKPEEPLLETQKKVNEIKGVKEIQSGSQLSYYSACEMQLDQDDQQLVQEIAKEYGRKKK